MVYVHELGHNLNMAHAGTDPENDGVVNSAYATTASRCGPVAGDSARVTRAGRVEGAFAPRRRRRAGRAL